MRKPACSHFVLVATLFLSLAFAAFPANAEDAPVFDRGMAVVTGFSGTTKPDELQGGNPLDETFIDLDGASAHIFRLEPEAPPSAQLISAPPTFEVKARDVGQVFAIGLDEIPSSAGESPNIFLGATSAFGLQIVTPGADGRPKRVKTGHPDAEWMAGQFVLDNGGGPGSIWQVDGKTGGVSMFATIPGNSGPGLGDIVFDPATRQFFASDLDKGLIHRLNASGILQDTFDHGQTGRPAAGLPTVADDGVIADIKSPAFDSENPATWGFTQPERRVWGLGLRAGRLYYAVAEGPEIWSVSINLDGTFGADPRGEIEVSGTPNNNPISDIAFDSADYMHVAQRGGIKGSYDYSVFADAKQSVVFRFKREIPNDPATPGIWVPIPDEYAIGFPPDYRNMSGGLALGYGYDQAGAMRRGACDATIWSTGDALRDSPEYAAQLAAGGPAIVNGLQGSDRFLIRPDNEPPFNAYFVDYDGKFDDPQNQGHVGDVEIWQPCDPKADFGSYAPAPYLPPSYTPPTYFPPVVPPAGLPYWNFNLRLDKEAVPGPCVLGGLGVLCDYVVRVTNTGPDVYFGPIVINDSLLVAPAGAVVTFADVPPWLCIAILPTEHQCTFGPTVLLPGDSVDLFVTVDLPVAAPVCHLDNLAYIVWPLGLGDAIAADDFDLATATIPAAHCPPPVGEKTNLKIDKDPWKPVCTDKFAHFECDYVVVVRNAGPGIYNGKIKVDETVPAGTTAIFFAGPSWTCTAAAPYSCEHDPVVLDPNQTRSFGVRVKVPKNLAGPLACQATNKVKIVEALGGTDQNTDSTDDEAEATAILPGQVAQCPELPPLTNLKLKKTGPDEKCPVVPGGNWECTFKVRVQNFGGPYTSAIQFVDVLPFGTPAGATVTFQPPPGWNCGGPVLFPNLYQCSSDNPNLPHLGAVDIPVTVKIPIVPMSKCEITNNAQIVKAPGGTLLNSFAGDDFDSAKAELVPVFPQGGQGICLSPAMGEPEPPLVAPERTETNLTITKTAGPSEATATGQNTAFTITVTNEGPGVFNGPIEVLDTLFDGATVEPSNGSWSVPWVCEGQSAAGHPEQGICVHPDVELDPGESVVLTLEIEAPNSFVAPTGSQVRCSYKNNVEILDPLGGSPQNTNAGDDTATAEVKFAPFEKHGQTFCELGLTTPPPSCPQGWSRTPVPGKCCPPRSGWDGERCKREETPPKECPADSVGVFPDCRCKPGYAGTPPNCRKEPVCESNKEWIDGACRCRYPLTWNGKRCVPKSGNQCPADSVGKYPDCRCKPGTTGVAGDCKRVVEPPKECAEGFVGTPPNCRKEPVCESNKEWIDGACRCRYPLTWNGKRCVPKPGNQCPADSVGKYPDCRCKPGTTGVPGGCKRIVDPPKECPKGFRGTPPNCRRIVEPPKECPKGFRGTPPNCKRIVEPPKECPKGFRGTPPNCKRIVEPPSSAPLASAASRQTASGWSGPSATRDDRSVAR